MAQGARFVRRRLLLRSLGTKVKQTMIESMPILAWITLGVFSGWIISQVTQELGAFDDVVAGVLGALAGGVLFPILFRDYADGVVGTVIVPLAVGVSVIVALRFLPGRPII